MVRFQVIFRILIIILITLMIVAGVWTVLAVSADYSLMTNNDVFVAGDYLSYSNGKQLEAFFPDDLESCNCLFIEYSEAHLNRLLPPWFYWKKYSDLYYLELFFPSEEASGGFFESVLMDHPVSSGAFSDEIQYAFLLDCCADDSDRAMVYHNAERHTVAYCWFEDSNFNTDMPVRDMYKLPYQFPAAWDPRRCGDVHFSLLDYALPTASLSSGHTAGHSEKDEYGRERIFGMEAAGELFNDCGNGFVYVYYVIQERTDSQIGLYPEGILVSEKRLTTLSKEWKDFLNEND